MLKFLRQLITQNILLKVSSVNALSIGVRMVCGLITSKLIAFYLGASGMAILGDLRNFMASVQSASQLGISNGVIKYSAELKDDKEQFGKLVSTAFKVSSVASVVVGLVLIFGAGQINRLVFDGVYAFTPVIRLLGIVLPLFTLNTLLLNVVNGLGDYKKVIQINIVTNLFGVVLSAFLMIYFNLYGALLALVLSGVLALVITGFLISRTYIIFNSLTSERIDKSLLKKLASYGGMTLFSAVVSPWVYIAIRQHIISVDGLENAGYWDAMLRLSDYYLMFATSLLTLYVLPKLAAIHTTKEFRKEVFNFYKTILPFFALGLVLIFFLKTWIIKLVFNDTFLEMQPVFVWQLAGDFFRVASLVIGYQMIAKNMFSTFIITQIFSLGVIYFTSTWLVSEYGFVGAAMGHFISYVVYLIVLLTVFRKSLFGPF